jgi:glutaconate CoA-transferase, subunit B
MSTIESPVEATPLEIMAVTIARDLRDGEWVEVGANLPVPRAGALLAHLLHGPNMTVMLAMTKANLINEPVIDEFEYITDVRAMRWAEAFYQHDQLLNNQRHRAKGVFFCGGIQIDKFGNSNLIGIGSDPKRLKFRGPGAIGTCNATVQSGRWHLVTTSHEPRVLVDRVDYISALGYGDGEPGLRERLGIPNPGPSSIITPLCVFDFDASGRARLKSVHRGVSRETVAERTGFAVDVGRDVPITPDPTPRELETLRTRIDVAGALGEFRNPRRDRA